MMASRLQESIADVYDMELNNYFMNRMIRELDYRIRNLGGTRRISAPEKRDTEHSFFDDLIATTMMFATGGAGIGAVGGVIYGFITGHGFWNILRKIIEGVINGALILGLAAAVVGIVMTFVFRSREKKKLQDSYVKAVQRYKKNCKDEQLRQITERKEREILIAQKNSLEKRIVQAKNLLNRFYNSIGIDESYRNLVAMGYMDEFMRLEISDHLEGTDGLYYLIRQEIRADAMQYTLDEIATKLDTLIDNQREIYRSLKQMDTKCNNLICLAQSEAERSVRNSQLLEEAVANTSIAAYNSERIRTELMYQNFILLY